MFLFFCVCVRGGCLIKTSIWEDFNLDLQYTFIRITPTIPTSIVFFVKHVIPIYYIEYRLSLACICEQTRKWHFQLRLICVILILIIIYQHKIFSKVNFMHKSISQIWMKSIWGKVEVNKTLKACVSLHVVKLYVMF